jgi:hypothetical protein
MKEVISPRIRLGKPVNGKVCDSVLILAHLSVYSSVNTSVYSSVYNSLWSSVNNSINIRL